MDSFWSEMETMRAVNRLKEDGEEETGRLEGV
jgi:hypothetical protein